MEGLDSEDMLVIHDTITTTSYKIFDKSIYNSGKNVNTIYSGGEVLKEQGYDLSIYTNGLEDKDKGHVSVELYKHDHATPSQVTCIVSLIDASETQRFSQTFTMSELEFLELRIGRYISHEKLLSDPDDLLPEGLLTLKIEVWLTAKRLETSDFPNEEPLYTVGENGEIELHLDTPAGKLLTEESKVFRAMLNTPMIEKRTKITFFDNNYTDALESICELLEGRNILAFTSMDTVLEMYIVADMYDMPFVIETCTTFLKLYLSVNSTDELLEIVDKYIEDEHLKELLENQISLISETNFVEEIDIMDTGEVSMKQPVQNCLWVYKTAREYMRTLLCFLNRNAPKEYTEELSNTTDSLRNEETVEYPYFK